MVVDDLRGVALNAASYITSKRILNIAGLTLSFFRGFVIQSEGLNTVEKALLAKIRRTGPEARKD